MHTLRQRIMKTLMVLCCATLPGGFAECDFEDGELEIDFEGFHFDWDDDWDDCDDCGWDFWLDWGDCCW
jgi:hypothetical protein